MLEAIQKETVVTWFEVLLRNWIERLRNTTKILSYDNRSPVSDFNLGHVGQEAVVLPLRTICPVNSRMYNFIDFSTDQETSSLDVSFFA
jgi:hypothetical protein